MLAAIISPPEITSDFKSSVLAVAILVVCLLLIAARHVTADYVQDQHAQSSGGACMQDLADTSWKPSVMVRMLADVRGQTAQ